MHFNFNNDDRLARIHHWLSKECALTHYDLKPLAGDASFRRYFRVKLPEHSWVLMDAPPEKETSIAFVAIARAFSAHGLNIPEIIVQNVEQGFILLKDFGDRLYFYALNEDTADTLYQQALVTATHLHSCPDVSGYPLPKFDIELYQRECALFIDWYCKGYLKIDLSAHEQRLLNTVFDRLIEMALSQPQVCVHRDYHSRNLFVLPDNQVGIIDFQDAVWGPVTYDAVSLLRDCYVAWPDNQVQKWLHQFQKMVLQAGLMGEEDPQQFTRWFDWMGLQRHFKCLGIFARLYLRDGKSGYLQDIPRVLQYAQKVSSRYEEFADLHSLLQKLQGVRT